MKKKHITKKPPTKVHAFRCTDEVWLQLKALAKECGISLNRYLTETVERPLCFAPFGQTGFAPVGHNIIAPCKVLVQGLILFYPFRHSGFS